MPPASIYIVIVLYNQSPADSAAVTALLSILETHAELAAQFRVLLYDNSARSQQPLLPDSAGIAYQHDASNRGLAAAYNYALQRAAEQACAWLLLLDQDTQVTAAYLDEAVELTTLLEADARVAAIVPKLEGPLGIKSPTLDFLCWLRRQVQFRNRRPLFATASMHGLQPAQLSAFNSAAILRVSALLAISGFPADFWLDFLDVAVFHALDAHAGRVFVMHACLHHGFSMDTEAFYSGQTSLDRHRNMLIAMVHYVRTRGTRSDLLLARLYLLRNALNLWRRSRNKRFAWLSLRQSLLLQNKPTPSL